MGFLGSKPPRDPGPSATELRLEAESKARIAKEEKKAEERRLQQAADKRGRRSLFAAANEGAGFEDLGAKTKV
jgi:hypothetical protein